MVPLGDCPTQTPEGFDQAFLPARVDRVRGRGRSWWVSPRTGSGGSRDSDESRPWRRPARCLLRHRGRGCHRGAEPRGCEVARTRAGRPKPPKRLASGAPCIASLPDPHPDALATGRGFRGHPARVGDSLAAASNCSGSTGSAAATFMPPRGVALLLTRRPSVFRCLPPSCFSVRFQAFFASVGHGVSKPRCNLRMQRNEDET